MRPSRTALFSILALVLLAAGFTMAQQPPPSEPAIFAAPSFVNGPVGLTPAQVASFKSALQSLAQQGHTCIIAEDTPLHPTLAPKETPVVPDHTPLEAAVTLVANAYDYDAVRTGNVFVLTKRYTDPADLPYLTSAECAEDLHNASLVLAAFDPPSDWSGGKDVYRDRIAAILDTLTPDQLQAVFSQGVPIAALAGNGRTAVDQWNLGMNLDGPPGIASQYEADIRRANEASVGVSTIDLSNAGTNHTGSGVVTEFGRRRPNARGGFSFSGFYDSIPATGNRDMSGGPVTQAELDAAKARVAERKADGHETLAQAVAALVARGAKDKVSPALAPKTVTAAGETYAAPDAVLAGLAGVYGLRVHTRLNDGVTVLDLPERLAPPNLQAVRADALAELPAPLLRASHQLDVFTPAELLAQARQRRAAEAKLWQPGGQYANDPLGRKTALRTLLIPKQDIIYTTHRNAVRALRVAAALYPDTAKVDGLLTVSAMTPDDQALYTEAIMTSYMTQVTEFTLPTFLSTVGQEDQYYLKARVYEQPDARGIWKIDLFLNKPRPDGTLGMAGGMSDVAYGGPPLPVPSVAAMPPTP